MKSLVLGRNAVKLWHDVCSAVCPSPPVLYRNDCTQRSAWKLQTTVDCSRLGSRHVLEPYVYHRCVYMDTCICRNPSEIAKFFCWHVAQYAAGSVYRSNGMVSVRLSVSSIDRCSAAACGGFVAGRSARRRYKVTQRGQHRFETAAYAGTDAPGGKCTNALF